MVDHPSRGPRTPGPNHHANHPHQMPDYNDGMYQQPQPHTGMGESNLASSQPHSHTLARVSLI